MRGGCWLLLALAAVGGMLDPCCGVLFSPDPCPDEVHCLCAAFTIRCQQRNLSQVPSFFDTGYRYAVLDLSRNNITEVGAGVFSNVSAVTTVDLSHNPLTHIQDGAFAGLEDVLLHLELEACKLSKVPNAVGSLRKLQSLNLRHNPAITFLNGDVMAPIGTTLESLDFSNTGIRQWPLGLKSTYRLKTLLSSGNQLDYIPPDSLLAFFNTLTYLDLSYNAFRAFPDAISKLRVLNYLDLSFNLLGTIPAGSFLNSHHTLETLYLVHVMLRDVPPAIRDLSALKNLHISYNPITAISDDAFKGRVATSLQVLHLDKTLLQTVPLALSYLTALRELNFTWNRVQYLENYALDLPHLTTLYLDKNPLVNIKFAAFAGLNSTKNLYIRNTSLQFVPNAALARAPSLTLLDLSFNHFTALYDYGFPSMAGLRELSLKGNPLGNVSANALTDLTGVTKLNLDDCRFTAIPKAVQTMHALRSLSMAGNDIACSCDNLGWVETWRADQGLIAKVGGLCSNNRTQSIQSYLDNEGRSCLKRGA